MRLLRIADVQLQIFVKSRYSCEPFSLPQAPLAIVSARRSFSARSGLAIHLKRPGGERSRKIMLMFVRGFLLNRESFGVIF